MATGALDTNGIWQYGEDDSNTTFSALLNRLGTSIGSNMKGRIAQVVSVQYGTITTNSTTTYVATGLTATITPTKASSKILVFAVTNGIYREQFSANGSAWVRLMRNGSTVLSEIANMGYTSTGSFF